MSTTHNLALSDWQQYVVNQLGLDAWYLQPLTHSNNNKTVTNNSILHEEHHLLIDKLISDINQQDSQQEKASQVAENNLNTPQATEKKENYSSNIASEIKTISAMKNIGTNTHNTRTRKAKQMLPVIAIDQKKDISPPNNVIPFLLPCSDNSDTIDKQLTEKSNIIILPPKNLHNNTEIEQKEQKLLTSLLASINISLNDCYQTTLLKEKTQFGQDANEQMLQTHLSYIASELALTKPKNIWIFGRQAAQAILQTNAPLAHLIGNKYQLQYQLDNQGNDICIANVICLPSLNYLLAMPSEKSVVWKTIKHFPQI